MGSRSRVQIAWGSEYMLRSGTVVKDDNAESRFPMVW